MTGFFSGLYNKRRPNCKKNKHERLDLKLCTAAACFCPIFLVDTTFLMPRKLAKACEPIKVSSSFVFLVDNEKVNCKRDPNLIRC